MTAGGVATAITDVQSVGDLILTTIEGLDPGLAMPAEAAEKVLDLAGTMVQKALAAWSAASGVAITPDSVAALMPNATPLSQPTEG